MARPYVRGSFQSAQDNQAGKEPVVFDVLGPDRVTSLLPPGLKMVLHVNPRTMQFSYAKQIDRSQTRGGFVEYHWGDGICTIAFEQATGGFMRLYTGLSNSTNPGGRRQSLAYQKYLDYLALFHFNGSIYDVTGTIVSQGFIKITFSGGVYFGWFEGGLTVTESVDQPYQFAISSQFNIDREALAIRFRPSQPSATSESGTQPDAATSILDPMIR